MAKKSKDRWPELCRLVDSDDGLPVRESGRWAEDKLWFWHRYIEITTTAMVASPRWKAGLVYVDLFAGPGVCHLDQTNKRIPGSPLIAARAKKPFRRILLCEKDRKSASACETRMQATPATKTFEMFVGDCNKRIDDIVARIPHGALTLAFLDPTGLHAHISTLAKLSAGGRVDLLILFPDAVDAVRNVEYSYFPKPGSNLDQVLGDDSNWRAEWKQLGSTEGPKVRRWFAGLYRRQLERHAGYSHFGEEVIRRQRRPLYRLVYATKHARGLDFWSKVTTRESGGQKRLFS